MRFAVVQETGTKPEFGIEVGELTASGAMQGEVKVDCRRFLLTRRTRRRPVVAFEKWGCSLGLLVLEKIENTGVLVGGAICAIHVEPTWLFGEWSEDHNLKSLIFYGFMQP